MPQQPEWSPHPTAATRPHPHRWIFTENHRTFRWSQSRPIRSTLPIHKNPARGTWTLFYRGPTWTPGPSHHCTLLSLRTRIHISTKLKSARPLCQIWPRYNMIIKESTPRNWISRYNRDPYQWPNLRPPLHNTNPNWDERNPIRRAQNISKSETGRTSNKSRNSLRKIKNPRSTDWELEGVPLPKSPIWCHLGNFTRPQNWTRCSITLSKSIP